MYSQLVITALCPVLFTALLYFLNKKTKWGNMNYWVKQSLYGLIFGGIAILSTELGVHIDGAVINSRDAAPLAAGLIFGAPAGIIAGLIGGIERWLSVFWGAGEFMSFAGAISTVLAGCFGAGLRKWMFDDKKPAWYYGLAIGFIMEIIHMMMLFFTNMHDVKTAFTFVQICFAPMVISNSLSVMLSVLVVGLLGQEKLHLKKEHKRLTQTFSRWLLVVVLVSFAITSLFTYLLQTSFVERTNNNLLQLNLQDVRADIKDASNENLLRLTRRVATILNNTPTLSNELVTDLCVQRENDFSEINVIDTNGIIIYSSTPAYRNFDMRSGEQSGAFMVLVDTDQTELVQNYQPTTKDQVYMKYAGVQLAEGGFVQVGYNAERFRRDIDNQVIGATRNRHVGEKGYMIIAGDDWNIVSNPHGHEGENLEVTGIYIDRDIQKENIRFEEVVYGEPCYCMYNLTEGYYIIAVEPITQVQFARDLSVFLTISMGFLIFTIIFVLLYLLVKKLVVENIHEINYSLKQISHGNLDVSVDVRTNEEFISLSDDINSTVATLKGYIAAAAARIDKELEMAKIIQTSALPTVFPPYPERTDFDIYARMDTAKEVGGDFYDLYLLDENRLAFLVADVSGKGITAALFMMKAKTLIKGYAEKEDSVAAILTKANEALCEGNDAEMFVTCWMGILNFTTHKITYVNAGHNPPLVLHKNGPFEYFKTHPGFVLGGMEGIRYKEGELTFQEGDKLVLYTDGITEATNAHNELYGEERLLHLVNLHHSDNAESICFAINEDVNQFVGEAPQFDDMTLLCLELTPQNVIRVNPQEEGSMNAVLSFVENTLTSQGVASKLQAKMNIAVDEIFSNILHYSKATEAAVECDVQEEQIQLVFTDNGIPYNPLQMEDPDTEASADERKIGGLGVFMVKKTMDKLNYHYQDNHNVLILIKKLDS